jgi:hypothetical protein
MIIYMVIASVHPEIANEFINWMTSAHVPDVVNTGCFQSAQFCRLNEESMDADPTFIIQYYCESHEQLDNYFKNFAPALRKEFNEKYGEKCKLSRSVMEMVKEIVPHS